MGVTTKGDVEAGLQCCFSAWAGLGWQGWASMLFLCLGWAGLAGLGFNVVSLFPHLAPCFSHAVAMVLLCFSYAFPVVFPLHF